MNSETKPLVSVIIPTYNSGKYIADTLKSVLNQTYTNFEIIIVDDSSTDNTEDVISQFSSDKKSIRFYRIPHAGRPSIPRNYGIKMARGNLIAFLDSDDIWSEYKLEDQVEYMLNNPVCVMVYSMSVTFGDVTVFSPAYEVLPLLYKAARNYEDLVTKGNSVTCSTVLIRSDILRNEGGFDEDPQLQIEDYELWIRLSKAGAIGFIPRIHVYYRVHNVQFSGSYEVKKERLEYLAAKLNINLPPYKFVRTRGITARIARNSLHYANFLYVIIKEWIERYLSNKSVKRNCV